MKTSNITASIVFNSIISFSRIINIVICPHSIQLSLSLSLYFALELLHLLGGLAFNASSMGSFLREKLISGFKGTGTVSFITNGSVMIKGGMRRKWLMRLNSI